MTKGQQAIRDKGDFILQKMNAIIQFGTGRPEYFPKTDWESVTNKTEMKQMQVALWNELKTVDPMRAELVKPQNPYVK